MQNAVCYLFSFFVEAIILWQYSSKLFSAKRPVKSRIFTLCGLYAILFCVSWLESIWFNLFLYFLLNLVFLMTQYDLNWGGALFHDAILTAVMAASELMIYGITKRFAPHFLDDGREFFYLVFFTSFSKLVFLAVSYFLMHLMQKPEKNAPYDKSVFLLLSTPLVSIFIMFTFLCIGESVALPTSVDWLVVVGAVFLLFSNLLVFQINQFYREKSAEFTELQLLLQKESDAAQYYKMLNAQHENQRILIHDMKKHLQSMDTLSRQKEYEKLRAYIRQLIHSQDLQEASRLCDNALLNSILCRYRQQCREQGIAFHADIRSKTTGFMADNDITALFCNLLDNAVAAAASVPDAFIEISTGRRDKTPFIVITAINSCAKNPFSEKGKLRQDPNRETQSGHGFGLKSIRKAVDKYHGEMQMYYSEETHTVHTIITLKQELFSS